MIENTDRWSNTYLWWHCLSTQPFYIYRKLLSICIAAQQSRWLDKGKRIEGRREETNQRWIDWWCTNFFMINDTSNNDVIATPATNYYKGWLSYHYDDIQCKHNNITTVFVYIWRHIDLTINFALLWMCWSIMPLSSLSLSVSIYHSIVADCFSIYNCHPFLIHMHVIIMCGGVYFHPLDNASTRHRNRCRHFEAANYMTLMFVLMLLKRQTNRMWHPVCALRWFHSNVKSFCWKMTEKCARSLS